MTYYILEMLYHGDRMKGFKTNEDTVRGFVLKAPFGEIKESIKEPRKNTKNIYLYTNIFE